MNTCRTVISVFISPTICPMGDDTIVSAPTRSIRANDGVRRKYCSGLPSGSGAPGASHASDQPDFRKRPCFPVKHRVRTVSDDWAASSRLRSAGMASLSRVVSHTEPHHTPSAPSAIAAATWRPRPMPPAASTGNGATASTICGVNTMVVISPVCPPASWPCAMIRSTPAFFCLIACSSLPTKAPIFMPAACAFSTRPRGGVPMAVTSSLMPEN